MTPKPAAVRFYVDADMLGLAKVLAGLRADVTYPGDPGAVIKGRRRPACVLTAPATRDVDWIPVVAANRWLAITRDAAIARRPAEIAAVIASGARLVALAGDAARGTFWQLEVVMSQWRWLEAQAEQPGPFVYSLTRTAHRLLA